jgi:hypothetical protein
MKKPIIILGIIIGAVIVWLLVGAFAYKAEQKQNNFEPYRTTLTGVQTCLPHKDTSGPQTLECAIGMKTDSGEYYAVDFSLSSQMPPEIQNGERFTASGLVTPIERLSSDHWQKYNVKGIFSITDVAIIEGKIETPATPKPTPNPVTKKCFIGGCSGQMCSDEEGPVSTCEYREEYACYKSATCGVQANGECGWTVTSELTACLAAN